MMPLKLSMLQPWAKARTYILHWDFGFHHQKIVVTRYSFWRVINNLNKDFEFRMEIKSFSHGNHFYHYLKNYFGEWVLVGEVIYVKSRPVDLDLEMMFA